MHLLHEDTELGIGYKERLARKKRKKCDRSARLAARRGALIESGERGVCARSFRACVYSTGVHLDSVYVSRVFLNRRAFQSSSPCQLLITLFMHVSFSLHPASTRRHMCLPPFLSPSAAPQGSLLNAAICLRLRLPGPPVPSPPSPAPPLVNHGANCRSRRGGRGQPRKVKVEVGDKDRSH